MKKLVFLFMVFIAMKRKCQIKSVDLLIITAQIYWLLPVMMPIQRQKGR